MSMGQPPLADSIARVVEYNRWRRGDETIEQPAPKEIGLALDQICYLAENLITQCDSLREKNHQLRIAIRKTIEENLHLADGETCTLKELKLAIGYE